MYVHKYYPNIYMVNFNIKTELKLYKKLNSILSSKKESNYISLNSFLNFFVVFINKNKNSIDVAIPTITDIIYGNFNPSGA